ncbi:universal stress protein [Vulgatibacter sp.]|uniref:universal stress protein n=1 Tax=Vulgatibacter sp. TaxID=1971226 RepID=UPI003569878B
MFEQVTAAIDGSPASFRAAALGAEVAAAEGGSLELVAVAPPRTDLATRLGITGAEPETEHERRLADLRSAETVISRNVPLRRAEVVDGPVVESILGRCERGREGRLICVGSGKHRLKLGSVSAAVLRESDCPVLVVREGSSRGPLLQRLLVGFDGTPGSLQAVDAAADLSAHTGAEVHLVWVLRPSFPMPPQGLPLSGAEVQQLAGEPEVREMQEAARRITDAGGKVARKTFELGKAGDRILALGDAWDVDLIVIGARGRTPARRRFIGGVSDRVAARSMRPVLVVK